MLNKAIKIAKDVYTCKNVYKKSAFTTLKKVGEAAYLCYTLTGPLAGLPLPGAEVAASKLPKVQAESILNSRELRKREEDILAFILNSKTGQGV